MELAAAIDLIRQSIPRAYLVGGFVRDELLGIVSKDADIEVFGMEATELEKRLHELFDGNVETVGRSFGVFKVLLGRGVDVDVAIPRRESKSGKGHKDFVVEGDPSMSIEEAARRRDFTINAMYRDLASSELVDPFGGANDLSKKLLRAVDPKTFIEDPLRIYRAVQFTARFGLKVDEGMLELMRKMVEDGELDHLPSERVTAEIKKLLVQSEKPSIGFELMCELGIVEKYFPELFVLGDTPQEPEWHPEGDVWIHTMMVIDRAARIASRKSQIANPFEGFGDEERLYVVLGALCHDLGKPSTTKMGEKDGKPRIRSLGHEEAGVEPTKSLMKKWDFGQEALQVALVSAKEHLKPGMLSMQIDKGQMNEEQYVNSVRKLLKRIHPVSWRILLAISESDYRGRTLPGVDTEPYIAGERMRKAILEYKLDEAPTKPLLSGSDLLPLGVEPGPRMGEIIKQIESARDEGTIKSHEDAVEFAKKLIE
jgi:tRNA nucleotidyltransferase (CCA-adding enzyme)